MPADSTIQTALVVIAIGISIQTFLMVSTVIAMAVAWRRAQTVLDARLSAFAAHMDDLAGHTRVAVAALERSTAKVDAVLHDAGSVVRTVATAVAAPRTLLMAGAASAASAYQRWRARHEHGAPDNGEGTFDRNKDL